MYLFSVWQSQSAGRSQIHGHSKIELTVALRDVELNTSIVRQVPILVLTDSTL